MKKVISSLTGLGLTTTYPAVKTLLPILSSYEQTGDRHEINMEVPELGRRIVGVLATSKREQVWLKLEKLG